MPSVANRPIRNRVPAIKVLATQCSSHSTATGGRTLSHSGGHQPVSGWVSADGHTWVCWMPAPTAGALPGHVVQLSEQ